MSIRFKVILPYLLLTLIVAVTGAYIVTRLVSNTLEERLHGQLIEAGRVVSDSMVRQEQVHVNQARSIAYTHGIIDALTAGRSDLVVPPVLSFASAQKLDNVFVFNTQGQEFAHILKQPDGTFSNVTQPGRPSSLSIVNDLLKENNPDSPPKRGITTDPINNHYYYFTSVLIVSGDGVTGVAVIGTSLNALMPLLKNTSLADVILYDESGHAVASTFDAQDELYQRTISIPTDKYQTYLHSDSNQVVFGETLEAGRHSHSFAYGPLKIGNDRLGVFAVSLSSEFIKVSGSMSRWDYALLYAVAMILVIAIGYFISRLIIVPLMKLVRTSRIIASGDLTKRTEIKSKDEIGMLANTFDEMTDHLQQRTLELEKTNKTLEQMDAAKMRFIQVAAHELRTPLTLVQGYSQMIQVKAKQNNEYVNYANGIVEGTTRMVEIIDNMLDVSRIDSNLLEILPVKVEIAQVIERVRKTFEPALQERNLTFVTQDLQQLPGLLADKELLYKLFYHVIVNAIKYTPDGGCITVSAKTMNEPALIEIAIKDTGIGVAPENQELVFEKFYQTGEVLLHSSGKTKFRGGGPGLGLAIARGIVNAHHGHIRLESPGFNETTLPGTTVFVRLPIEAHFDERK